MARPDVLPLSLPPRGLTREQAAAYVGVGPTKFDEMIQDGRMPKPKRIDARVVWDRHKLDMAFAALPDEPGREERGGGVGVDWNDVAS
jgi:predicted DNA-binding transcriptional regulator AlpA